MIVVVAAVGKAREKRQKNDALAQPAQHLPSRQDKKRNLRRDETPYFEARPKLSLTSRPQHMSGQHLTNNV